MQIISDHEIRFGGYLYSIYFSYDEEQSGIQRSTFSVTAQRKCLSSINVEKISISIKIDNIDRCFYLRFGNDEIGTISFDSLEAIEHSLELEESDADDAATQMDEFETLVGSLNDGKIEAAIAEKVVEHFPGDPIIGCLVKGAVSAVLGQTIRCWYANRNHAETMRVIGAIYECLKGNSFKIARNFIFGSGKCIIRVGF